MSICFYNWSIFTVLYIKSLKISIDHRKKTKMVTHFFLFHFYNGKQNRKPCKKKCELSMCSFFPCHVQLLALKWSLKNHGIDYQPAFNSEHNSVSENTNKSGKWFAYILISESSSFVDDSLAFPGYAFSSPDDAVLHALSCVNNDKYRYFNSCHHMLKCCCFKATKFVYVWHHICHYLVYFERIHSCTFFKLDL